MADAKIVQEWLAKADDDLAFVNSILNDTTFFAQVCFHLHQAAEKYLKAVIVARDLEFKKVHDLKFLLNTYLSSEPSLAELSDDCAFLNRYYIDTRYPVHWPTNYTREETLNGRAAVARIADRVKAVLEPSANREPP